MKLDILAIAAHPDDIELCCSGTLIQQVDKGRKVGIADLTRGELGTRGNANLRQEEAEAARQLLGAVVRENLEMPDGFFEYSKENILKIIRVVRKYQPTIVLANALRDRHPDHARAARLISDACYYSGLRKIPSSDLEGKPQEPWRPKAVYHFIQDYQLEPDFVVDITDYIERKKQTYLAFKSQFYDPGSEEPESPISTRSFLEYLDAKARVFGRPIGVEFAEGFQVGRTPGVEDIMDLK